MEILFVEFLIAWVGVESLFVEILFAKVGVEILLWICSSLRWVWQFSLIHSLLRWVWKFSRSRVLSYSKLEATV